MMIDEQTIDHEMAIDSIKISIIVLEIMAIGTEDHETTCYRDTIIEIIMVMKKI